MSNTYLNTVNNVLIRLREPQVSSVTDTEYSSLIGVFVNDAKREVEDAYDWNALLQTKIVSTLPNTASYTVTGSGDRFTVISVFNDTEDIVMNVVPKDYIDRVTYLSTAQAGAPSEYAFTGVSNGDAVVSVNPLPDGPYQLRFNLKVPELPLSANSDLLKVPYHLVQMLAYANAVAERGEDGGQTFAELYQKYRLALADAIALENSRYGAKLDWVES
jgi:hypothetical protein